MSAPAYALASTASMTVSQLDALLDMTDLDLPVPASVRKANAARKREWLAEIRAEYWEAAAKRPKRQRASLPKGSITAAEVNDWLRSLPPVPHV